MRYITLALLYINGMNATTTSGTLDETDSKGIVDNINMGLTRPITAVAEGGSDLEEPDKRGATLPGDVIRAIISSAFQDSKARVLSEVEGPDFLSRINMAKFDTDISDIKAYRDVWRVADNINQFVLGGGTSLMRSSEWESDIKTTRLLLDYGADITLEDKYGCTALCYAVRKSQLKTVKLLLNEAIERGIADYINMGRTRPLTVAKDPIMIKFLSSKGASLSS